MPLNVIENPAWNMDQPRERPFGSVRTTHSLRDVQQQQQQHQHRHQQQHQHQQSAPDFRLRVHDHDEHQFEPPSPSPEKPHPILFRKHHYIPLATPAIVIALIVVFVLMMYSNDCPHRVLPAGKKCVGKWLKPLSFQPWDENPMLGPQRKYLLKWGALESTRVVHRGQGWRLLSAIFINGGVLQLIMNLLALLIIGLRVELNFGFLKLLAIYLVSGFGGSVLSALLVQRQVFAGASGAVMGLIGACFADMITNWNVIRRRGFKFVDLILFTLISVGFGLMPQVDNFANVGGFLIGLLLGFVLLLRPQPGYKDTRHLTQLEAYEVNNEHTDLPSVRMYTKSQKILRMLALLILLGLLIAGCVILFLDIKANKSCKWCHYLACVPHLKWTCPGPFV